MKINEYYNVGFDKNLNFSITTTTRKNKSSLKDLYITALFLNTNISKSENQVVADKFKEIWTDIKKRIEQKKQGFSGLFVRFFFFVQGKNEIIKLMDDLIEKTDDKRILEKYRNTPQLLTHEEKEIIKRMLWADLVPSKPITSVI